MTGSTTHFGFSEIPTAEKVKRVKQIFDSVADNYDLMNDLMSMGVHRLWKWYAIHKLRVRPWDRVLDVAGGTGDLAHLIHRKMNGQVRVDISDINHAMLKKGQTVLTDKGTVQGITWSQGNAEALPFPDNTFNIVTIGFGIRNVTNIDVAVREMVRVLRPGGRFLCLEFSQVALPFLRPIYESYSFKVLPEIGHWVAKDRQAYQYLVESIRRFPDQETFKKLLEENGLASVNYHNLTAGVAAIHTGFKV